MILNDISFHYERYLQYVQLMILNDHFSALFLLFLIDI